LCPPHHATPPALRDTLSRELIALLQANARESAANLARMSKVRQLCAVSGEFD